MRYHLGQHNMVKADCKELGQVERFDVTTMPPGNYGNYPSGATMPPTPSSLQL